MNVQIGPYHGPFRPWRPSDGRLFHSFAFDVETTDFDRERPDLTPAFVIAAAFDGQRGVFITRPHVAAFFVAHHDAEVICHNASFDLRVTDVMLRPAIDLYSWVENRRVWDTMVLERLLVLATEGHPARGQSSLAACARKHLKVELAKEGVDEGGQTVRTGFGRFLNRPPSEIPKQYLSYLAQDVLATWYLYQILTDRVGEVLTNSNEAFGFVDRNWLAGVVAKYGPLTHHIQVKASILMDALTATGIGIDQSRSQEKTKRLEEAIGSLRERLRLTGYLPGEPGCDKALQAILRRLYAKHPDLRPHWTKTSRVAAGEDDLDDLAAREPFVRDLVTFRSCQKLQATYLAKMNRSRLHARFGWLLQTGRTYCGGGFNLQNLPREKGEVIAATVRGCFVPPPGHIFIDCDYSQVELVVLGSVLNRQLGLGNSLSTLVNGGRDVHLLIAAAVLGKPPSAVTAAERQSAKAVSFGRPGGMGVGRLQQIARTSYQVELSDEEVQGRIDAYHQLCPELNAFLDDEINTGFVIAEHLNMTPADYAEALGMRRRAGFPGDEEPQGWLGGMLLKVVAEEAPATKKGRPYSDAEKDFFWAQARRLPVDWPPALAKHLQNGIADVALRDAIRNWAGRRPCVTMTGRLRAHCTFCASRNTLFQGAAADGAILGLWLVWRAGFKVVDFIHDQVVVESPADDRVPERLERISTLMRQGMLEIVPGMTVKVEGVVTRSLNKDDADPRYTPYDKNVVAAA